MMDGEQTEKPEAEKRYFTYRWHHVMIRKTSERFRCQICLRDVGDVAPAHVTSLGEWVQFARNYIDAALRDPGADLIAEGLSVLPPAPPTLYFMEPHFAGEHGGLTLSSKVGPDMWRRINRYFSYHSFRESADDDEDAGGYWQLRDTLDLRLVERQLGIPPENRYGIRPGTEGENAPAASR